MSRGLVPFTVPNERSALQAGNVGGNADSFRPMAEHGSGRFFIIRWPVLRRHLQASVAQVFCKHMQESIKQAHAGKHYISIRGQ
jgi:hypothetical protein